MSKIYKIDTYQEIISFQLDYSEPIKGAKSRLAEVAGVQPAYLSQVLAGCAHLNLDQALNMAHFWDFNENETDYFLDLVSLARASSQHLKKRLKEK